MYFEQAGADSTQKTLEAAFRYAKENNVRRIIVALTTGRTARMIKVREILAKPRQF